MLRPAPSPLCRSRAMGVGNFVLAFYFRPNAANDAHLLPIRSQSRLCIARPPLAFFCSPVQIPPPMDRRAASYVSDQLVYEEFQPVEAPPPSLGAKDPFQREVGVDLGGGERRAWKRRSRKSAGGVSLPAI